MCRVPQYREIQSTDQRRSYAFMQAAGLVNDHTTDCFCYQERVDD